MRGLPVRQGMSRLPAALLQLLRGQALLLQLRELGHERAVPIANRTRNPGHDPGCPYCHNRKVLPGFNDLATTHPEIAMEWDPNRSCLKPTEVMACCWKEAWWIAPCRHHFAMLYVR